MKSTEEQILEDARTCRRDFIWFWSRDNVNPNPHPVAEDATRAGRPELGGDDQCL